MRHPERRSAGKAGANLAGGGIDGGNSFQSDGRRDHSCDSSVRRRGVHPLPSGDMGNRQEIERNSEAKPGNRDEGNSMERVVLSYQTATRTFRATLRRRLGFIGIFGLVASSLARGGYNQLEVVNHKPKLNMRLAPHQEISHEVLLFSHGARCGFGCIDVFLDGVLVRQFQFRPRRFNTPQPQNGTVSLIVSDAPTEDWATIGVKVLSDCADTAGWRQRRDGLHGAESCAVRSTCCSSTN